MVENTGIVEEKKQQAAQGAPAQDVATANPRDHSTSSESSIADSQRAAAPKMQGFFNRHTSGYWAVMLPALSARYLPEAAMKLGTAKMSEGQNKPQRKRIAAVWDTAYGLATGALMMGVTTFYAHKTYKDIKNVFAEPVAAETGKKPEDVTMRDIFKSDNTLVKSARQNFVKYNARRYAVNLPFFGKHFIHGMSGDAAVGFGVATNSVYLMNDVFRRKETFFERLQGFIEQKIKHTDELGDKITALDLINLNELQARNENNQAHKFNGRMDTPEWSNRLKIFGRMADLMNKTYGNEPNKENANFNLSKMIYLMGHGMIDSNNPDRSCAYIEVANAKGLDAVKDVAKHGVGGGADMAYAKQNYGACMQETAVAAEKPGFAAKFASEAAKSNTEKVTTQRAAANENAFAQTM